MGRRSYVKFKGQWYEEPKKPVSLSLEGGVFLIFLPTKRPRANRRAFPEVRLKKQASKILSAKKIAMSMTGLSPVLSARPHAVKEVSFRRHVVSSEHSRTTLSKGAHRYSPHPGAGVRVEPSGARPTIQGLARLFSALSLAQVYL
jgi:hypothetical protein